MGLVSMESVVGVPDVVTGDVETGDVETGDVVTGDVETGDVVIGLVVTGVVVTDAPGTDVVVSTIELPLPHPRITRHAVMGKPIVARNRDALSMFGNLVLQPHH